jgi:hypothetical protein
MCLAVGMDSLGHEERCERLFAGMRTPLTRIHAATRIVTSHQSSSSCHRHALQNETTQTGGAICVAHLCHVDLVRLNCGERLRQI